MELVASTQQVDILERIETTLQKFITPNAFSDNTNGAERANQNDRSKIILLIIDRDHNTNLTFIGSLEKEVKSWINPPLWRESYDHAQKRRAEDSTEWFTSHPTVEKWLSSAQKAKEFSESSFNCLFVRGDILLPSVGGFKLTLYRQTRIWKDNLVYQLDRAYSEIYRLF